MNKWFFIVVIFCCSLVSAQELSAYLNHDRVKIGEPVVLTLSVKLPSSARLKFEEKQGDIAAFRSKESSQVNQDKVVVEITETFRDTMIKVNSKLTWKGEYSLVPWDTGKLILPKQAIFINDSTYYFDEVILTVSPETIGVKDELFDIEEGFTDIENELSLMDRLKENWYWVLIGFVALVFGVYWFFFRKKKEPEVVKVLSLKERTILAIDALERQRLWEKGDFKAHYTELSYIIRAYLSSRYELNLLERTTQETQLILKKTSLSRNGEEIVINILKQADLIKFANFGADELNVLKNSLLAKQMVIESSPLDIENEE